MLQLTLPAVFLLAAAASAQDTTVIHVNNPPVWGETPQLVEELRIGVLEGDERYSFGNVVGVATTQDGTIWITDNTLGSIRRYGPDGTYIDDVGRKGKGPGEFSHLSDLRRLPNNRIAVWDPLASRVHIFEPDGGFRTAIRIPVGGVIGRPQTMEVDIRGSIYAYSIDFTEALQERILGYWIRVNEEGASTDTIYEPPSNSLGRFHMTRSMIQVSPMGYIVEGRNDEYAFHYPSPSGVTRLERAYEGISYKRPEREESQALEEFFAGNTGKEPRRIPLDKPVWATFNIDADGRLWVERYLPGEKLQNNATTVEPPDIFQGTASRPGRTWGQPLVFDVIEANGRFLGTLPFPNTATTDVSPRIRLVLQRGMEVWTVEKGKYDEQYVVRYRIVPEG